ncbi:MAG: MgtC/SapB family protein [Betaproteobacteria bacterium]|nr:MgtC/SapB family protein [Betaproteobacteria bacterium]
MSALESDPRMLALLVSLGIGLLIGIERERSKGTGPTRAFAGVRTFTIVALTGCLAQLADSGALVPVASSPWLAPIGAAVVGALIAVAYWRDRSHDPGITTELALFITYVLGVTAVARPAVAAGAGVVVAMLLASRHPLHRFSRDLLSGEELRNGLLLAGAALVVLPLLPDRGPHWAPALNPHRVWRLVVVVLMLQAAGHVALRIFGARSGLALSGFFSGFVSSTATMAAMGHRARLHAAGAPACASGALLSNVATMIQLAVLAALVNPDLLRTLAWPLVGGAAGAVIAALFGWRRDHETPAKAERPHPAAFQPLHALGFAALMTGVTALVSWLQGSAGALAATASIALAGFADAHAAGTAAFNLAAEQAANANGVDVALLTMLGVTTNTLSKGVAASVAGGAAFMRRVAPGLALLLAGGWLGWWLGS